MIESIDYSDDKYNILFTLNHIFSALSFATGIIVLITFYKNLPKCSNIGRMAFLLNCSNLVYTITNFITLFTEKSQTFCAIDGLFRTSSTLSILFWATKIALTGYRAITSNNYNPNQKVDYVAGFIIPLVLGFT